MLLRLLEDPLYCSIGSTSCQFCCLKRSFVPRFCFRAHSECKHCALSLMAYCFSYTLPLSSPAWWCCHSCDGGFALLVILVLVYVIYKFAHYVHTLCLVFDGILFFSCTFPLSSAAWRCHHSSGSDICSADNTSSGIRGLQICPPKERVRTNEVVGFGSLSRWPLLRIAWNVSCELCVTTCWICVARFLGMSLTTIP